LAITSLVLVAELVGAALTDSLALLADAGHMFTDVAGIVLAVLAVTFAAKPATTQRTLRLLPAGDPGRGGQRPNTAVEDTAHSESRLFESKRLRSIPEPSSCNVRTPLGIRPDRSWFEAELVNTPICCRGVKLPADIEMLSDPLAPNQRRSRHRDYS
jgi:hypothetical protein